jgi:hypothetical protein
MLILEALVTVVFVVVLIAASVASADTTRTEQRLRRLERGDPATAEAVRRAQAVTDYARGSFFGLDAVAMMCTPSRRSLHVGGDLEEPEPEVAPPVVRSAPVAVASDAATRTPPSDRRDVASARLSRRAVRTAPATTRRRAGIR